MIFLFAKKIEMNKNRLNMYSNQRPNIAGLKTLSLIGFGFLSAKELRYFAGIRKFNGQFLQKVIKFKWAHGLSNPGAPILDRDIFCHFGFLIFFQLLDNSLLVFGQNWTKINWLDWQQYLKKIITIWSPLGYLTIERLDTFLWLNFADVGNPRFFRLT